MWLYYHWQWQWRPLSTSHFSFSQPFTKPQDAGWHCWCPSQTLCALLRVASPVAVFWRLPWGHWHCLFQHRELEVPGADVLGWGRWGAGRRASRAVAVGCRSMNLSFSASHRDESWGIKYIPELPAGLGQRHSFQDLVPDFILSSCWWLALLTAKSFF